MNVNDVTHEEFMRFLKVRNSGEINMTDIVRGAIMAHISEEVYETIIFNFSELKSKYGLATKVATNTRIKEPSKTNKIIRIHPKMTYQITFHIMDSDFKIKKTLGSTTKSGLHDMYQVLGLSNKVCSGKLPNLIHIVDADGREKWQTISLIPGSDITYIINN